MQLARVAQCTKALTPKPQPFFYNNSFHLRKMEIVLAHRNRLPSTTSQEMDPDWPLPPPVLSNEPGKPRTLIFPALEGDTEDGSVSTTSVALIQQAAPSAPQGKFLLTSKSGWH